MQVLTEKIEELIKATTVEVLDDSRILVSEEHRLLP